MNFYKRAAQRISALLEAGTVRAADASGTIKRLRRQQIRAQKRETHFANRRFDNERARRRRQIAAGSLKPENGLWRDHDDAQHP